MQTLKSNYVPAMRALAHFQLIAYMRADTEKSCLRSWRRWGASLFDIYGADEMVQLDLPSWNVAAKLEAEELLEGHQDVAGFQCDQAQVQFG